MSEAGGRPEAREQRMVLALLFAFAAVLSWLLIRTLPPEPHSEAFHDELIYAQQARDIAAGGFPRYNRIYSSSVPPLYGLVQAPVRHLAGHAGRDWWSRVVNVLLLVSSLAPLYCLGRRLMPPAWAALAAGLGVVGPSLMYLWYLLSESLYIPLFLWLALAVTRVCERPNAARSFQLGLVLGLCYLTRSIAIACVPAVPLALLWSLRSPARVAKVGLLLGVSALLVVLPWSLRAHLFSSEANLLPAFSYGEGLSAGGLQPLGTYLLWVWRTLACFLIGLGPVALVVGTAGLFQGLGDTDAGRRGFASFVGASAVGTLFMVGIATAQWGPIHVLKLHERYLVPFWPLFGLAMLAALHRGRVSRIALAIASALFLAVLLALPDSCFDPDNSTVNPIDFPTSELAISIAALVGSTGGARLLYLALGVPVVLLLWKRRSAVPVLVVIAGSYSIVGAWIALYQAHGRNRATENIYRPVWTWLDGILRDDDLVIHHRVFGSVAYHNAMRYDMDFCQLDEDLTPWFNASVSLDRRTGRFEFVAQSPPANFWLLTEAPGEVSVPGVHEHNGLRLMPVQDGLAPLGPWLGGGDAVPVVEGREADGWCRGAVRIGLAHAYPCQSELSASVTVPEGAQALELGLLREGTLLFEESLRPGATWAFYLAETLWSPGRAVSVEPRGEAALDGRALAFRMSEPTMSFEPWVPLDPSEASVESAMSGIYPDRWCERRVAVRFPLWPEGIRFSVGLRHPADSPLAGALGITLRVGEHAVTRIELEPGASHELVFTASSDRPYIDFVLEADRDALVGDRRVAFQLGWRERE